MIRSKYVSNHIKSKKKIKYSYIVIKKRAHLLVEILMKEGNIFLHRIQLNNAENIAYELVNSGLNVSWLYPEMPIVSNAIEKRGVIL